METMIQNSSKQMLIRGTHTIWMMETENWVISLKTHPIQTSSYPDNDRLSHSLLAAVGDTKETPKVETSKYYPIRIFLYL